MALLGFVRGARFPEAAVFRAKVANVDTGFSNIVAGISVSCAEATDYVPESQMSLPVFRIPLPVLAISVRVQCTRWRYLQS